MSLRSRSRAGSAKRLLGSDGFTLLEVMVSLAILLGALVYIAQAHIDATRETSRAKMLTVATMLGKAKMNEIEADMFREGFSEFEEEDCGDFGDDVYGKFEKFKWCVLVEKIELPENLDLGKALGLTTDTTSTFGSQSGSSPGSIPDPSQSPLAALLGGLGGMSGLGQAAAGLISSQFGMIRNVIEQAIRRVTLTISWDDGIKKKQYVLVTYFSDPNVIDRGIMFGGGTGTGGIPNVTGSSKSSSSSSSSSSTSKTSKK